MTLGEKVKRIRRRRKSFRICSRSRGSSSARRRTPYTSVFLQECERMNKLLFEMKRSLIELDLGKATSACPRRWRPSCTLCSTISSNNLEQGRLSFDARTLVVSDALAAAPTGILDSRPRSAQGPRLAGFFNAQAFLTAVMQSLRGVTSFLSTG